MSAEQLNLDKTELANLLASSSRPSVRRLLEAELKRIDAVISSEPAAPTASVSVSSPATKVTTLPTVKITSYGWDESDNFAKIYITLKNVQTLANDQITSTFTNNSFDLKLSNLDGKNYFMTIKGLRGNIVPNESLVKQKTDSLVVMMKKEKVKQTWGALTTVEHAEKEKNMPKFDDKADPQAALMDMMKKMYDDGDDEMKRSIRKAWHEGGRRVAEATLPTAWQPTLLILPPCTVMYVRTFFIVVLLAPCYEAFNCYVQNSIPNVFTYTCPPSITSCMKFSCRVNGGNQKFSSVYQYTKGCNDPGNPQTSCTVLQANCATQGGTGQCYTCSYDNCNSAFSSFSILSAIIKISRVVVGDASISSQTCEKKYSSLLDMIKNISQKSGAWTEKNDLSRPLLKV
ncbi:unnamed protein product [Caenorhabditis auriculariae]|uniref:Calcyclin-binding protein n=1 Tax=Caenorhabditis auriculariae TaxID=2777116 RepID=A0A8S1GT96_9PELO|nr:unnamed protein product [Caenorhabditis auriculariae]